MRNCPWVGALWAAALRALERSGAPDEQQAALADKALTAGMQVGATKRPEGGGSKRTLLRRSGRGCVCVWLGGRGWAARTVQQSQAKPGCAVFGVSALCT